MLDAKIAAQVNSVVINSERSVSSLSEIEN